MLVSDAINGYLTFRSTEVSPNTIITDRVVLGQFTNWLGDLNITAVNSETIINYLKYQRDDRNLSPYTIRRHLSAISGLYNWLTSDDIDLLDHNPATAIKPPKLPRRKIKRIKLEHIQAMLTQVKRTDNPRRARALVLFLLDSGARATEAATTQVDDIDLKSGRVLLSGKPNNTERFSYLGKRTLSAVWLYVEDERPQPAKLNDNTLFLGENGYPLDRHSIRKIIYRLAKWAGVKASPHLFRHQMAIERLRGGMDVFTLKEQLGHARLDTTQQYLTALSDEDVERQARRTSPVDNYRL